MEEQSKTDTQEPKEITQEIIDRGAILCTVCGRVYVSVDEPKTLSIESFFCPHCGYNECYYFTRWFIAKFILTVQQRLVKDGHSVEVDLGE